MQTEKETINPAKIIHEYARKFGIPARDIHLHIQLEGNDLYSEECCERDWLVDEGIITDKKNNIELIPMYWSRGKNDSKVIAIRGK